MRPHECNCGGCGDQVAIVAKGIANFAGEFFQIVSRYQANGSRFDFGGRNLHALPQGGHRHEPVGRAIVIAAKRFPLLVVLCRQGEFPLCHGRANSNAPRGGILGMLFNAPIRSGAGRLVVTTHKVALGGSCAVWGTTATRERRHGEGQNQQGQGAANQGKAFHSLMSG